MTISRILLFGCFYFLLIACSPSKEIGSAPADSAPPSYSITYLIHGDANYVYHSADGTTRQADRKVLEEAKKVARKATHGEVFIFHQRPERKILWLFPKKDRQFYHFKNGVLIRKESYSPAPDAGVFDSEAALMHKYQSAQELQNRILLYFGHEIPLEEGQGYFATQPKLNMNTGTFSQGIEKLQGPGIHYDLTVLSTCNNGSPAMAAALSDRTRVLLASPQNLHLSHIDTEKLNHLERDPSQRADSLANRIARDTYQRLNASLQTVVSLSTYKMKEVRRYIERTNSEYQDYLHSSDRESYSTENIDCASLPFAKNITELKGGVEVWYRAPRFGRNASIQSHSGWGCKQKETVTEPPLSSDSDR